MVFAAADKSRFQALAQARGQRRSGRAALQRLRQLTQPLAAMLAEGSIEPGALVRAKPDRAGKRLLLIVDSGS